MAGVGVHRGLAGASLVLARLLLPPSMVLDELVSGRLVGVVGEASRLLGEGVCAGLGEALERVGVELAGLSDGGRLEEYRVEYTRVLLTDYEGVSCPPYESVYVFRVRPRQIAMLPVVDRLRSFYSLLGLELGGEPPLTEDHGAVELEFLAALHEALADAEGEVLVEGDGVRRRFVREHLAKWVPRFASCLKKNTRDPLLLALAGALDALVECESRL